MTQTTANTNTVRELSLDECIGVIGAGTTGHVDHGKTTLTAAITNTGQRGGTFWAYTYTSYNQS